MSTQTPKRNSLSGISVPTQRLRDSWLALLGLSAVFLFEMLDNSVLSIALPTIGRSLHASVLQLGMVNGVYPVVFASLMLLFGAVADRFGKKRVMLIGLALLGIASLSVLFVTDVNQLIAVRALMGAAAAMTAPLSLALTFRLFTEDSLRIRAMSLVSAVGLIGLAVGPTAGGLALEFTSWKALLVFNAPLALLSFIGVLIGISSDEEIELHRKRIDVSGAVFGAVSIALVLLLPTVFSEYGLSSVSFWTVVAVAVVATVAFILRERTAVNPILPIGLVSLPLVSSGLLYKASAGLATAVLSYVVTLQLQFVYGWSPALAAIGALPQVAVLLAVGPFVDRFTKRVGLKKAAWLSSTAIIVGLVVYSLMNAYGYVWVAISLALVAAGMRVNGLVAGNSVFKGLPKERLGLGAALVDTSAQLATGVGIAIITGVLSSTFRTLDSSTEQATHFANSASFGVAVVTVLVTVCTVYAFVRSKKTTDILSV